MTSTGTTKRQVTIKTLPVFSITVIEETRVPKVNVLPKHEVSVLLCHPKNKGAIKSSPDFLQTLESVAQIRTNKLNEKDSKGTDAHGKTGHNLTEALHGFEHNVIRLGQKLRDFAFRLGAIRSKPDPNDIVAETHFHKCGDAYLPLPETLDYRPMLLPVRNQGNAQSSCVAQVGSCILEFLTKRRFGMHEQFSPQFIYNQRDDPKSAGMSARELMKILQKAGDCYERTYPYGRDESPHKIPEYAKAEARNFRIGSYASISTINGLKTALMVHGPALILFPCYHYGYRMWIPLEGTRFSHHDDEDVAGHSFCVVGWTRNSFLLRGSWGDAWLDKGNTEFPFEDFGLQWEIWCLVSSCADHWTPPGYT